MKNVDLKQVYKDRFKMKQKKEKKKNIFSLKRPNNKSDK